MPVGFNKVSVKSVPPGEFVIKQIGGERESERDPLTWPPFACFWRLFFSVKIAANVALIITNDFIYHISYVLC